MVEYDADEIRSTTAALADQVGLAPDLAVDVRIDESVPLGAVRIASTQPLVLEIQGGALEDPKRIRQYHRLGATRVIGRLLFQAKDLLDPGFGTPPDREEMSLQQRVAWDAYAMGRVERLGYDAQRQRWLYAFRTRHGFDDVVDRAFATLWSGEGLTWSDIVRISEEAAEAPAA